ncbi:MAG: hypothetical protein BAJALOKI1v1_20048 [Promethearchaeota archaeon]|nr:MAG: hypothetical protein BAJALOKI1v1_20048 [Candidatus Lokiarchaeota archaeon]
MTIMNFLMMFLGLVNEKLDGIPDEIIIKKENKFKC